MHSLIQELIDAGHAYPALDDSGDVYFDVRSWPRYGELTRHGESVVLPLLLADSPIVVWWPDEAPKNPAEDPIGRLGSRRITDSEHASSPPKARGALCCAAGLRSRPTVRQRASGVASP